MNLIASNQLKVQRYKHTALSLTSDNTYELSPQKYFLFFIFVVLLQLQVFTLGLPNGSDR